MSLEDNIVDIKIKQKGQDARIEKQDGAIQEIEYRVTALQRLLDEQNEFLAEINVNLSKLTDQFRDILSRADKWIQRVIGGAVALLIAWVVFADAPADKIKWLIGLFA